MKHIKLIFIFLLLSNSIFSQNKNEERLEEGNLIVKSDPNKAITIFKEVITKESDTSIIYARALFNIAVTFSVKDDIDSTIFWYDKIIASNLNDRHPGIGFFETYACYHHNAAIQLAIYLFHKGKIEPALKYFNLAYTDYPYQSSSGTSIGKRNNTIEIWIARCFMELNKFDQALLTLINSSCGCYTPMQNDIDNGIKNIIIQNGRYKAFKKKIDKGLKKLISIEDINHKIVGKRKAWKFNLYGGEIILCAQGSDTTKESVLKGIKKRSWYSK